MDDMKLISKGEMMRAGRPRFEVRLTGIAEIVRRTWAIPAMMVP